MIRRILLFVSVILVGAFLYFGYDKIQKSQQTQSNIYELVPVNSIAIIELSNPTEQWNDLVSNNIIWDELQVFENVTQLHSQIAALDSTIKATQNPLFGNDQFSLLISLVPTTDSDTKEKVNLVFQFQTDNDKSTKQILESLNSFIGSKNYSKLENGMIQFESNGNLVYGFLSNNVISLSVEQSSLTQIQSQIENGVSLLNNPQFIKVKNTSSKGASIRFFMEPKKLLTSLKPLTDPSTRTDIDLITALGAWVEMDVDIMPDEVSMGGFITAADSTKDWISLFKNQEAIKPRVVSFLPNRTAFMMHFGFSEFSEIRKKMVAWQSEKIGSDFDVPLKTWDTLYDVSIEQDFLRWIDNEIALVVMEPDHQDISNEAMVWISSSDALKMNNSLTELSLKVSNQNNTEFYSIQYRNNTIHKLDLPYFMATTLGREFEILQENYFTTIDDYLVFANSPATLQWTLNRISRGNTLKKDPHYQSFENRISAESNIFIYTHIAGSPAIYQSLANHEISQEIENYKEWLQKFQVGALQISFERDNLYYVNNYWKYNPVYKKESTSLWELALDNPVKFKPTIVKNHYTNASEIFVQDTGNNIYLISNKGKILWKRKIDEPIESAVTQVDVFRNNKLQLAFNTKNNIYIIDRNGKDLTNFPIRLPDKASSELAILDYEKNKNYRLIIATNDGQILNYGIKGNRIKGWDYTNRKVAATQKITHLSIKNKDYLIAVYRDGSVKALDRKGNIRINLKSKFNFSPIGNTLVHKSSDLENSYILAVTANNEVVEISLTDKKTRMFNIKLDSIISLTFANVDHDGSTEIIASDSNKIIVYKTDGNVVVEHSIDEPLAYPVNTYKFGDNLYLGYVSTSLNKIYLSNINGDLFNGFPMNGSTPFTISDINKDGRFNVITVNEKGVLFNYTLEN